MKKIIIFIFSFLFGIHSYSTDTTKAHLVSPKTKWSEIMINVLDSTYAIINYVVEGDTTINDTNYFKVLLYSDEGVKDFKNNNESLDTIDSTRSFFMGLRESNKHEVYAWIPSEEKAKLIYDFSWKIGDTLYYQDIESDNFLIMDIIDKIDSIQLYDGNYYQSINNGDLIRGIGLKYGIMSHIFTVSLPGYIRELLCFYSGEQLIYKNEKYDSCTPDLNSIISIKMKENNIMVYPNPSDGTIRFNLGDNPKDVYLLRIFSQTGRLLIIHQVEHENEITLEGFKRGVYYYKLIDTHQNIYKAGQIIILK